MRIQVRTRIMKVIDYQNALRKSELTVTDAWTNQIESNQNIRRTEIKAKQSEIMEE